MTGDVPMAQVDAGGLAPAAEDRRSHSHLSLRPLIARWQWVIIAFVVSRLLIYMLIRLSRMILIRGEHWLRDGVAGVLTQDGAARYLEIAAHGYGKKRDVAPKLGLFPVYPKVVDFFSGIFASEALAGIVLSNVALLAAGILLKELVAFEFKNERLSRMAVAFLMFGPVSFFFSCAYPEALFLALVLAAFLAAVKGRWLVASLCGMAASATSVLGVLLVIPLLHLYWSSGNGGSGEARRRWRPNALFLALVPLGFAAFLIYSEVKYDKSSAPFENAEMWRSGLLLPWQIGAALRALPPFFSYFTPMVLGSAAALWLITLRWKMRPAYLIYAAIVIVACSCSSDLPSIARYLSVAFPLYIAAGLVSERVRWAYEPLLTCSFTALAFCTIMYANGHWAQ